MIRNCSLAETQEHSELQLIGLLRVARPCSPCKGPWGSVKWTLGSGLDGLGGGVLDHKQLQLFQLPRPQVPTDSRLGMYALPWQSAAQQVVETTEVYFPRVLEVRSPGAKVFQAWFLPRAPSSACR